MSRNYRGISELSRKDFLDSLEYFDDEYFIILKRNRPLFVAFPPFVAEYLVKKYSLREQEISVTDIQRKNIPEVEKGDMINIIRNNARYYSFLLFSPEIVKEGSEFLLDTVAREKKEELLSLKTQV